MKITKSRLVRIRRLFFADFIAFLVKIAINLPYKPFLGMILGVFPIVKKA
jgi:hypothetical protein